MVITCKVIWEIEQTKHSRKYSAKGINAFKFTQPDVKIPCYNKNSKESYQTQHPPKFLDKGATKLPQLVSSW